MFFKFRRIKAFCCLLLPLLMLSACKEERPIVTSLKVVPFCTEVTVGVGEYSSRGYLSVESEGITTSADFTMVSENEEIALLVYDGMVDGFAAFMVKGVSPGETTVYFQSAEGSIQSNPIYVTVTPKATEPLMSSVDEDLTADESSGISSSEIVDEQPINPVISQVVSVEEKEEAEPFVSDNSREESKPESSVSHKPQKQESKEESSRLTQSSPATQQTDVVYVTPSGKRYHAKQSCGGKNANATSLQDAIESGKTPCGKCVKQ